jgi:separase
VANLWDVTDKDIDRLTKSTFEHFGLGSGQVNNKSLPAAVAAARGECTLRYLNGAAPVVFGIPVRLLSR